VLFRVRLLQAIPAILALTACVDNRFMRVGVDASASGIPSYQQVEDSVRLVAREWRHQMFGSEEPAMSSSETDPGSYEWSSSNPAVAIVRSSGWMITRAIGETVITVKGPGSSYSERVWVCSRDTYLQIAPDDPVLNLHDTLTVAISLRQPGGEECGKLDFGLFTPQQGTGKAALEPIFSQPHRWRAIRTGAYWYGSSLRFADRMLRDSILVTVK
jgi:hypothetical protein